MGQTACFVAARAFPAVELLAYVDIDCYFARIVMEFYVLAWCLYSVTIVL